MENPEPSMNPHQAPQNLIHPLPETGDQEAIDTLAEGPLLRIERIVSRGHRTPEGVWYDQPLDEWVALLQGEALLEIEGRPTPLRLIPGDWLMLPRGCRHRVTATQALEATIWLAVHGDFAPKER